MHALVIIAVYIGIALLPTTAQNAASDAFTPKFDYCPPGTSLIRSTGATSQTLGPDEERYISTRKRDVLPAAWSSYLQNVGNRAKALDLELPEYVSRVLSMPGLNPSLGIAISGGGWKAATFGAASLNALDSRNQTATKLGTGGLLQAASYMTGLSGSSWLLMSLVQANFPTFEELIFGTASNATQSKENLFPGWLGQFDLLQPGNTNQSLDFVQSLLTDVKGKFDVGFPVTLIDVWGRTLSRHFVNGTTPENFFDTNITHGAGVTLSSLASLPIFQDHGIPFPIVVSDSISTAPNTSALFNLTGAVVPLTNPILEFNICSYDPMLSAFTPTKFLGSPNDSVCVTGFDQVGYIQGSSGGLFSIFNTSAETLAASPVGGLLTLLNATFTQPGIRLDAAALPNPFFGHAKDTFADSGEKILRLIDGAENGEGTPYQPLLVKARGVDTIIAIDVQGDNALEFTEGLSVIASQERASILSSVYSFPSVPTSVETWRSENLAKHPTFFGCNSTSRDVPLLIYIANGAPPLGQVAVTNVSTTLTIFPPEQARAIFDQSFDIATQGIPVLNMFGYIEKDPEWPICLACAVVDRMRLKSGAQRSGICASCLDRYCWS
ncbi:unnamed protein product [Somion occarium]|uniref:Lysophospholipase n=1 Tax=Somion occarium TaxID=3059160 RepID=A0ABP1CUP6_9APHY